MSNNSDLKIVVITDSRTNRQVMRIPAIEKPNGELWVGANSKNPHPITVISHLPDHLELREKYLAGLKSGNPDIIAPEHRARFGKIGPFIIETADEAWKNGKARDEAIQRERANTMEVYVSPRGWGDYSPLIWRGPADRPTGQIMAECRKMIAESWDVDFANQSDEELAAKIEKAKTEAAERRAAIEKRDQERRAAADQRAADTAGMKIEQIAYADHDEGGKCTVYRISVQIGEKKYTFLDRNLFDVGRCVNPAYSVAPGMEPGGLGVLAHNGEPAHWEHFSSERGWTKTRDMESDEARAFAAVVNYYGHAGSQIRM